MSSALSTRALTRQFGSFTAVDSINLDVPRGSFYGFLGPNGAGKSTTIKCLTGLLRATSGEIRILDKDPAEDPISVKREIGVVPEDLALFDRLSAAETLAFVGQVHGMESAMLQKRSAELLALMSLEERSDSLVTDFSHGMKKKLSLAVALLGAPKLLFLDEPFEGIDVVASRQIRELLRSYVQRGGTIFLTSHILEIVERLCDHIGIIHDGKLVAQGSVEQLRHGNEHGASLEEIFLNVVGADSGKAAGLDWLG